jgi:multidrug efflux pump subunit AcrA (membrane-fusion protein)
MNRAIGVILLVLAVGAAGIWAGAQYGQEIGGAVHAAMVTLHLSKETAQAPAGKEERGEKAEKGEGKEEDEEGAAKVRVAPLVRGKIEKTITAYGTVMALPGTARAFTLPFESRATKVLVVLGQVVEAGAPLMEVEASPDSLLMLETSRDEAEGVRIEIKLLEQRLEMKLGTRLELLAAQQKLRAAEVKIKNLEARGLEKPQVIKADAAGLVSKLGAQPGQIVPLGTSLVETVAESQIGVKLGFEGNVVGLLKVDQPLMLVPVGEDEAKGSDAKIALITRQFEPATKLVTVFAIPAAGVKLFLDDYLQARVPVEAHEGFLVPRTAVVPEEDHFILFTVEKEKAVKRVVKIGFESGKTVEVVGDKLKVGQPVITMGAGGLKDGSQVEAESSR